MPRWDLFRHSGGLLQCLLYTVLCRDLFWDCRGLARLRLHGMPGRDLFRHCGRLAQLRLHEMRRGDLFRQCRGLAQLCLHGMPGWNLFWHGRSHLHILLHVLPGGYLCSRHRLQQLPGLLGGDLLCRRKQFTGRVSGRPRLYLPRCAGNLRVWGLLSARIHARDPLCQRNLQELLARDCALHVLRIIAMRN